MRMMVKMVTVRVVTMRRMVLMVNLVKFADDGVAADPGQISVADQRRLPLFVKLLSGLDDLLIR